MPGWYSRDLETGMTGEDVAFLRRKFGLAPSDDYDKEVEIRVRAVQVAHGLPRTGLVDSLTAEAIGESERHGLVPDWYVRPLALGDLGEDVEQVRHLLGLSRAGVFDAELDSRVRRYQSQQRIAPTGVVDEATATRLGDDVPFYMWG